jgi:predicted GNAT superfamily acetyltransferase
LIWTWVFLRPHLCALCVKIVELSPLSLAELDLLIRESFFSATMNDYDALLIAFDQSSRYQHVNFL